MMQKIDGKNILFKIPDELLSRVDKIAKRHGHSRSESLRILIEVGLDVHDSLSAVGMVRLAEILAKYRTVIDRGIGKQKLFGK